MRPKKPPHSGCPIDYAATMFGDRWTLLLLRDLSKGMKNFREFAASNEGVATNILASRLKLLERFSIVTRHIDPTNRRQVVYKLTQKGLDLTPIMLELTLWSSKYDPNTIVTKEFVGRATSHRDQFIREIVARLASAAKHTSGK
ncbi:MAG: helix-turn-helix transcriptional regulator [Alphaproteobacteria bacterium]|nr:helix-turn-helix transcriptional regulator [Alphaproteobacteria bacterium]